MSRQTDRSRTLRPTRLLALLFLLGTAGSMAFGQAQEGMQPPPPGQQANGSQEDMGPPPMERRRPPMERAFHMGPHGRWWNDPQFVTLLGLTPDQQKKMEDVFQQNRPKLMDLSSQVKATESQMAPLLEADQPDEAKVLTQIDRIAQTRAELEKANARMLLGLRRVLTQDQWKKLQANDPSRHPGFGGRYPHHEPGSPDVN